MCDVQEELLGASPENMSEAQLAELVKVLKERCQLYESKNAVFEKIFDNLRMLDDYMSPIARETLEIMPTSFNEDSPSLIVRWQQNSYLSKVKTCVKYYNVLNEAVSQTTAELKSQLEATRTCPEVAGDYSQNILVFEEKLKKYEMELHKLQKKNSFLNNPEYNLLEIEKDVNTLRALKEETERLVNDLKVYADLKPSIAEARQQLKELKAECNTN